MSAYTPDDVLPAPQRRIRHITSLQIRNLTPFPARDALAKTLTQPSPNASLLSQQPADDIDLTFSRRRRRVSASSISTGLNVEAEDDGGARRTNRRNSKGSFQSTRNTVGASSTSTIRPRVRTSSKASAVHPSPNSSFSEGVAIEPPNDWDIVPAGGQFLTHSQRALEKIVSSRLVESFITLTLPPSPIPCIPAKSSHSSPLVVPSATTANASRKATEVSVRRATSASVSIHRRGTSTPSSTPTLSTPSSTQRKRPQSLVAASPSPSSSRARPGSSGRAPASSKPANFPSPPPTPPPRHSPTSSAPGSPLPTSSSRKPEISPEEPPQIPIPFYISPSHLPSTNPRFSNLDPEREFAPWADLSGSNVKVAIWGRDNQDQVRSHTNNKDLKGKGKAPSYAPPNPGIPKEGPLWKILEEWIVDLDDIEPLSDDVAAHRLPSNTLLLTVSSGETFRIPPISSNLPSRAPSPLGPEYNSDGEVNEIRLLRWEQEESESKKQERATLEKSRRETRMKRSAGWQDLVKIVNLQTCIVDTEESLDEIVHNCNLLMEGDGYNAALREASERAEWLRSLRSEREQMVQDTARVKDAVDARRAALQLRRDTLTAARTMHEEDLRDHAAQTLEVDSERKRHAALLASLTPLRTTLIQSVSFIFPIEPLSAADLLFTIVGAPLPIPVSTSDPAPPLLLPSQPEVTEDNTATALGYVAQVVQLVSAYLGKGLVYPVTCCGSRSVIKDPISAMMGPRMFPLYSKGVETYRFEYGVFLLNKDIEMLMMDRNLRAMDMRHTLPNMKNLLLTLTTGEGAKQTRIGSPIPVILSSGLQNPTRAMSPTSLDAEQPDETHSKPMGTLVPRRSTPFLSPLAAILRARYPSSAGRPTVKVVDETPEPMVDGEEDAAEVQTAGSDELPMPDGEGFKVTLKVDSGAHARPALSQSSSLEKLAAGGEPPPPPSPLASTT